MGHDTCSICLEPLIHHSTGVVDPIGAALCGHVFHCECFWRWEESKRQQDWRSGRASRGCPCPVCNVPVDEFIRLFIDGDNKEIKKLRKELKIAKCKLARERLRLEKTRQELVSLAEDREDKPPKPRSSGRLVESSRRELEKDIQELVATAALLLGDPPLPERDTADKTERSSSNTPPSSYRRHESSPRRSSAPGTPTSDPPSISANIAMPPPPRTRRGDSPRTPERWQTQPSTQQQPQGRPRRRPEDAPQSPRWAPIRRGSQRGPSARTEPHATGGVVRPDPPRLFGMEAPSAMTSSMTGLPNDIFSPSAAFFESQSYGSDPPSCHAASSDSDSILAAHSTEALPHSAVVRRPLLNFLGLTPPQGLLGGCIYID